MWEAEFRVNRVWRFESRPPPPQGTAMRAAACMLTQTLPPLCLLCCFHGLVAVSKPLLMVLFQKKSHDHLCSQRRSDDLSVHLCALLLFTHQLICFHFAAVFRVNKASSNMKDSNSSPSTWNQLRQGRARWGREEDRVGGERRGAAERESQSKEENNSRNRLTWTSQPGEHVCVLS